MAKVCINIGHSHKDKGAVSVGGVSEWDFNREIAILLYKQLEDLGHTPIIVLQDTYTGLPAKINETGAAIVVSLHFNATNGIASGTETLYWHTSKNGKALAQCIQSEVVAALGLRDRGILPREIGQRGAILLRGTIAPCVIVEPFFGDNPKDWSVALARKQELAAAIARGVDKWDRW